MKTAPPSNDSSGENESLALHETLKSNFRRLFHEWIFFQMKLIRDEGLAIPQLFILRYLYYNRPENLTSMADFLGVSKPTITGIMNTLEKDGYVRRKHDRKDRRNIDISLTQKSLDMFSRFEAMTRFVIDGFVESFQEESLQNLNEVMIDVSERLRKTISTEDTGKNR